ncbi:MAG: hypothetical protein D3904_01865 [Candidatus Electrothrix sp. EH2]|nr:hypothetical protein [Candidatus Electrothrix sp. EH2]
MKRVAHQGGPFLFARHGGQLQPALSWHHPDREGRQFESQGRCRQRQGLKEAIESEGYIAQAKGDIGCTSPLGWKAVGLL